jgi:ORF6N domain-containing protein
MTKRSVNTPRTPGTPVITEIERSILLLRGERVLLDADLAALYGVETRALVQAVKRNRDRFPHDFLFQLSPEEFADLRSQTVMSSFWGGRRHPPYAFTEQGVAMLSSVLKSRRAVAVNVEIMRAFIRLRRLLSAHAELARRIDELESRYDSRFRAVFTALRQLTEGSEPEPKRIGFGGTAE